MVGLDVGSTNIKAVVYDRAGRTVALASVPQETTYPRPRWASYDPHRLWELACIALRRAMGQLERPQDVVSIACSSFGEACALIDEHGEPLGEMIAWFDRRTEAETDQFAARIDADELFLRCGHQMQPLMTAAKLMWTRNHAPAVWERTRLVLTTADYMAYRLCGVPAQCTSLASRTALFNLAARDWDAELLAIAGVPREILADPADGGTPLGRVHAEAARATGIPEGTAVGVGGHDHVAGLFAAGAIRRGDLVDSMGTAEAVVVALDEPIQSVEMGRQSFTQGCHVIPGAYYTYGGLYTSGACVDWVRSACNGNSDHASMVNAAATVPAGSGGVVFIPHLRISNTPYPDSKARAAFVGISDETTTAHLTRSVLEGVAFEARAALDPLVRYAGLTEPSAVNVIGGTARNRLLIQIKASVMNVQLHVLGIEEAVALGVAMLGGIAAGVYRDAAEASAAIERPADIVEPVVDDVALYDELFHSVYEGMYPALRPLNHQLHAIFMGDGERDGMV